MALPSAWPTASLRDMSSFWRRVAPATVLVIAPMLASCGSGHSPSVSSTPGSSVAVSVSSLGATTVPGAGVGTAAATTSLAPAGSMASGGGSSGGASGGASSGGVTTTLATDPQVAALEQLLNDIDATLAALDKSLASDPAVAP